MAGTDDADNPDYSGQIGTISTNAGVGAISGEACVYEETIRSKPDRGSMIVYTAGSRKP